MTKPLFVQIHTLISYPGTLLNRDDVGLAKRLPFGGATRTRISSQCLKRHWRLFDGKDSLFSLHQEYPDVDLSVRSRESFNEYVYKPLLEEGIEPKLAEAAVASIITYVLGESKKAQAGKKGKKGDKEEDDQELAALKTPQLTVLGKSELGFFLQEARKIAQQAGEANKVAKVAKDTFNKEWVKNLEGLKLAAGLDAALFGRMVTSDVLSRSDAAVHVAHAFTVHGELAETDYFTAVDDLLQGGDDPQLGSAHINTTELTSGLFYVYVVVDVPQLVSNLEGCSSEQWANSDVDRGLAAKVVERLVNVISRVSPGAKKGSTAPYAYANLVLVEAGAAQPRTLANAFLSPVGVRPDLLANAYEALNQYVVEVDQMYGLESNRKLAAIGPKELLQGIGSTVSVADVGKFAAKHVLEPTR